MPFPLYAEQPGVTGHSALNMGPGWSLVLRSFSYRFPFGAASEA